MKKRHAVLLSLSLLAVITYLDRLCISIAGPRMQRELGFTPEQWGWIVGIFAISYGGLEIPAGALGDKRGQRAVIARIVIWWSAFTALTGSVSGFWVLLAVRFLFGVGEAGAFPNISGALSRWFPPTERARAQGFVWGSSRIGGILSPLAIVPMMAVIGWRAVFWIFGAIGIAWALLWMPWYRNSPAEHPGISRRELEEISAGRTHGSHTGIPWGSLFRSRQLWLVMLMYQFYGWGSYFYLSWLHTYLVKGRGLSEQEMGIFSTLPFVLGASANLMGGWLSDRLCRKYGLRKGRSVVGTAGLLGGALCVLGTALTEGKLSGVLWISIGYGCMDLMLPSAWAICMDLGGRYAGAVSGAMNSAGHVGGFSSSVLFGYIVRHYGSYNAPLLLIAFMLTIAAFVFSRINASRTIVPEDKPMAVPA
ncbi:MAG: MFS transporter [Acidobacteria bacterium]|nr:MFS transporter [Acidobacteriota bacterium]